METRIEKNQNVMTVFAKGRLDANSSPEFGKEVSENIEGVDDLTFDFAELRYLSSAGLRILLSCQKKITAVNGKMRVINVNELITEIFEATGFIDILTVEKL